MVCFRSNNLYSPDSSPSFDDSHNALNTVPKRVRSAPSAFRHPPLSGSVSCGCRIRDPTLVGCGLYLLKFLQIVTRLKARVNLP